MVLFIGERLCGGYGNAVARVNAHGVEVFDGAHDDAVIGLVADYFHLKLFPAQQRFFNQQLGGGRSLQPTAANGFKFFGVVSHAATCAAQREARANYNGKAYGFLYIPRLSHVVRYARACRTQTNARHGIFELEAVFSLVNYFGCSTNKLDLVFMQHAVAPQVQRTIECCLPAHGGQNGIGALFGNDFLDRLPGNGLNVSYIGCGRVGHDGGRVAVNQNNAVTLFAQSPAGLHARIIKLACLPNNDGAGSDNQNTFDVLTFWHGIDFI